MKRTRKSSYCVVCFCLFLRANLAEPIGSQSAERDSYGTSTYQCPLSENTIGVECPNVKGSGDPSLVHTGLKSRMLISSVSLTTGRANISCSRAVPAAGM